MFNFSAKDLRRSLQDGTFVFNLCSIFVIWFSVYGHI